mgnify:CR=1 FL=1
MYGPGLRRMMIQAVPADLSELPPVHLYLSMLLSYWYKKVFRKRNIYCSSFGRLIVADDLSWLKNNILLISGKKRMDIIKYNGRPFTHRFACSKGYVRCNNRIFGMEQGMSRIKGRLRFKDINAGAGNFAAV